MAHWNRVGIAHTPEKRRQQRAEFEAKNRAELIPDLDELVSQLERFVAGNQQYERSGLHQFVQPVPLLPLPMWYVLKRQQSEPIVECVKPWIIPHN